MKNFAAPRILGNLIQISGPIVSAYFSQQDRNTPSIYHAVYLVRTVINAMWNFLIRAGVCPPKKLCTTCEVQGLTSTKEVQLMTLQGSSGLGLGMLAITHQLPLCFPVGQIVLGRMLNVLGNPIDRLGPLWRFLIADTVNSGQ
uniref:ATP synthase CF1 beta subunit n=1 Tax=Chromera velia TaxID=505693 RepID=D9IXK9_9ALVE|nr:ATP synthase CF1 beta subunit [Chromera velia]ADJ66537.2 ATP synthase CF1 beta subunit [Chromera velia]AIE11692.1 ATP synthase CF1 beta subunit [Chromera velia]